MKPPKISTVKSENSYKVVPDENQPSARLLRFIDYYGDNTCCGAFFVLVVLSHGLNMRVGTRVGVANRALCSAGRQPALMMVIADKETNDGAYASIENSITSPAKSVSVTQLRMTLQLDVIRHASRFLTPLCAMASNHQAVR